MVAAGVLIPTSAASAATVAMTITVAADGHGPFTADQQPGGDTSDKNGIVRTNDSVVYTVTVNATGGTAHDETFVVDAPAHTSWAGVPTACSPAGSSLSGSRLTCLLGDLTNQTTTVATVLTVGSDATNGDVLRPTGSVQASDSPAVVAPPAPPVTISAAPRFDLSIDRVTPTLTPMVGPDGTTPGNRLLYPILIDWKSPTGGEDDLGYERLGGQVTFVDDVSGMFGSRPSPAVLLGAGAGGACGLNTGQFPSMPGGRGGGLKNVPDSGTITCSQAAPGQPVTVSISGIDSSLSSVPTQSVSGGSITGGAKNYIVSGYISLWVPQPTDGLLTSTNTFRDLVATSASGQTNYGTAGEPLGNNSISRNIGATAGGRGSLRYWSLDGDPVTVGNTSGKYGTPYVTPGQTLRVSTGLANLGSTPWTGAIVCQVIDRTYQSLDDSKAPWAGSLGGLGGKPQYAATTTDDPAKLQKQTCGDGDLDWHSSPEDVPGGPAAVGAVRWLLTYPAATTISFSESVQVGSQVPNYSKLRAFVSYQPGAGAAWVHDTSDPEVANSTWSDFLDVTSNLARISSKIVDPGYSSADTPDKTQNADQGSQVTYALYPTLTNATGGGQPETVTVTDTLPAGTTYVGGSATPTPTSVTATRQQDGSVRDVVVWTFAGVAVNSSLPAITFSVRVDPRAAATETTNRAVIASLRDVSDISVRETDRAFHVLPAGAVGVVDTAARHGVIVGDDLVWALRYTNQADSRFSGTDLITTLPFVGDDRGTTSNDARLAKAVPVEEGEVATYTSVAPKTIDLDPAADSNTAGGTTRWCTPHDFGTAGCPTSLDRVTGVRITRSTGVGVGASVDHDLTLTSSNVSDAAVLSNSFGLRVANLSLPVTSNDDDITVHSGAIGHRVWLDANRDGLQSANEKPVVGVEIRLTGTDDRGEKVSRTTSTGASGEYRFAGLRPGDYRVEFTKKDASWTARGVGDSPTLDSDVDRHGVATTALRADKDGTDVRGVSSALSIDAGLLPPATVIDPIGPGGPVTPAHQSALAFTGSTLGLGVGALALAAILAGAIALLVTRRRRERDAVDMAE